MILIAITGASGVIYGVELLKALKELNIETGLLISDPAKIVIDYELNDDFEEIKSLADHYFEASEIDSSVNSGSFKFDSLVIIPCSMKTWVSFGENLYHLNEISSIVGALSSARFNSPDICLYVPKEDLEKTKRIKLENYLDLPEEVRRYDTIHFNQSKLFD